MSLFRTLAVVVGLGVLAGGCAAPTPEEAPDALPRSVDELAAGYVRLAVALGEHDPLFLDHVFVEVGPEEAAPSLAEIAERADRLGGAAAGIARDDDEFRVRRIAASLGALGFRARSLLGEKRPVREELREVFGLDWTEPSADAEQLLFHVERALPGVAPLRVRVRRYYEDSGADADGTAEALIEALARCREQTLPASGSSSLVPEPLRIVWLPLAEMSSPAPFYRYQGDGRGVLELPAGLPLRPAELGGLACHEGTPGHHLQATVAEAQFRATGWPELGIVPLYDPRTAVFEGLSATFERLAPGAPAEKALRDLEPLVLRTLARYLDGDLNRLEAVRALDFEALVPDPHALLDHADRFGGYALVRPAADPVFESALETLLDPELTREERFRRTVSVIEEAMSPAELIALLSP